MSIALSLGNNLTTGGIFKPAAINNTSVNNVTTFASVASDSTLALLSTQTASSSSSLSFTSSIDSTYDEYIFSLIDIHPSNDNVRVQFNFSTDGGSNYNVTKTSSAFRQQHGEDDSSGVLQYDTALDLAQSTGYQPLGDTGNDNDQAISGYIHLFNPSNTSYVKNYITTTDGSRWNDLQQQYFISGYANTTSAINAVRFEMSAGTMDAGTIKMYGVKKS